MTIIFYPIFWKNPLVILDSINQMRSSSPLDLLNDIDRNLDDLKMTKLYAYLNADPRLFFEVAKAYEEDGQLDLAIANLRRALLFDPENRQYSKKSSMRDYTQV
mgnify:CR=1 FL=1